MPDGRMLPGLALELPGPVKMFGCPLDGSGRNSEGCKPGKPSRTVIPAVELIDVVRWMPLEGATISAGVAVRCKESTREDPAVTVTAAAWLKVRLAWAASECVRLR